MSAAREPDEIREEIETTRQDLGDTIEALAEKTDVKAQAERKIEDTKADARQKVDDVKQKAEDVLGKARDVSPDSAVAAAGQAQQKARENPVPLALIAAFAVGFLLGRLTSR
jgi:ElaB/YqjD/DUF883 family membrane-anchored ribosome-binding protein